MLGVHFDFGRFDCDCDGMNERRSFILTSRKLNLDYNMLIWTEYNILISNLNKIAYLWDIF
jgi:hypothetical protein